MKKVRVLFVMCFVLSFWIGSATAEPMPPPPLNYDQLLGSILENPDELGNSGDRTEEQWLEDLLGGIDLNLESTKVEGGPFVPYWYGQDWEYAIIKQDTFSFAYINTAPTDFWLNPNPKDTDGIFLSYLINPSPNPNGVTSHITFFGGENGVPEPGGMLLFGTCLVGLVGIRMRSKKK